MKLDTDIFEMYLKRKSEDDARLVKILSEFASGLGGLEDHVRLLGNRVKELEVRVKDFEEKTTVFS